MLKFHTKTLSFTSFPPQIHISTDIPYKYKNHPFFRKIRYFYYCKINEQLGLDQSSEPPQHPCIRSGKGKEDSPSRKLKIA